MTKPDYPDEMLGVAHVCTILTKDDGTNIAYRLANYDTPPEELYALASSSLWSGSRSVEDLKEEGWIVKRVLIVL